MSKKCCYKWIWIILILNTIDLRAQAEEFTLKGKVINATQKEVLIGATVAMINIKDSTRSKYVSTDVNGEFEFLNLEQAFYKLRISSVGYKTYTKVFRLNIANADLGIISVEEDVVQLEEVTIKDQVVPVQQKGDTTQYNADAFKVNSSATSADLVRKMPGITVDANGVSANGETVQQVLLDGKRFFGQDPLLSLNTIPAEVIDKVLVYDEESEQSKFTGYSDGNTIKTMDLITKSDKKNGQFGNIYAGAGNESTYKAGGVLNAFKGDRRLTLLALNNNINQQNFGEEDLIGLGGSGGRGGFRRGGNNNFITSTQNGITRTNSYGLNFSDQLSKKLQFEGSYFFNDTKNEQNTALKRETFLSDGTQLYNESQNSETNNNNQRLNLRLEYNPNKNRRILFRNSSSFQSSKNDELTIGTSSINNNVLNQISNKFDAKNQAFNTSNTLNIQQKLKKVGRTLSFNLSHTYRPSDSEENLKDLLLDSLLTYETESDYHQYGAEVIYTEPIGQAAQLAVNYEFNRRNSNSDIEVNSNGVSNSIGRIEGLSNEFNSVYNYHLTGVEYSTRKFSRHFGIGVDVQNADLSNSSKSELLKTNNNQFFALLPSLMYRTEINSKWRFFGRYSTSTTEPTVSQLQDVINNTQPLFVNVGNPNLRQSYQHALRMGFRYTNSEKNMTYSNFNSVRQTSNYIGSASYVLNSDSTMNSIVIPRGAQLTTTKNLDGYWSISNYQTFGYAIPKIKNNLNASVNVSYTKLPGVINGQNNFANTFSLTNKIGLSSNISKKIDYNVFYEWNYNQVDNSLQTQGNTNYNIRTLAAEIDLTLKNNWVLRSETYLQEYIAVNASFDTQYTLWNASIAKKFWKNETGELEFSVFDLLGQNQSFNQTVNSRYFEESQTEVLQQYFMLTFTYQIRNFK